MISLYCQYHVSLYHATLNGIHTISCVSIMSVYWSKKCLKTILGYVQCTCMVITSAMNKYFFKGFYYIFCIYRPYSETLSTILQA